MMCCIRSQLVLFPMSVFRGSFPLGFFKISFGRESFFKIFIGFVTILLLLYVLVFWPQDMWGS